MAKQKRNPFERTQVCDRLKESLEILDLSPSAVYARIGYSTPATLYSVMAGRCLPDILKLIAISSLVTPGGYRINLDWLLTGEGRKLIPTDASAVNTSMVEETLACTSIRKQEAITVLLSKSS